MSEVLKAVLKTVYGITDERAAGILTKPDEEQTAEILQLNQERVAKYKQAETTAFDNGHKKGKGESLTDFEKTIRDKYSITDEALKGDQLIETIVQNQAAAAPGKKGGQLSDDDIKAHPLYIQLQEQSKKEVSATNKQWEEKYNGRETELEKAQRISKAKQLAIDKLEALNPILPAKAEVANNLKNLYNAEFEKFDYDFQDGVIVVKKDGKVYEDAHGNRISFDEVVTGIAGNYFEFAAASKRDSAGNDNSGGTGAAGALTKKTKDELAKMIDDPSITPADKRAAMDAYKAQQAG